MTLIVTCQGTNNAWLWYIKFVFLLNYYFYIQIISYTYKFSKNQSNETDSEYEPDVSSIRDSFNSNMNI